MVMRNAHSGTFAQFIFSHPLSFLSAWAVLTFICSLVLYYFFHAKGLTMGWIFFIAPCFSFALLMLIYKPAKRHELV